MSCYFAQKYMQEALKKEEITKSFETAFGKITEEGREGNSVSGTMLR